MFQIDGDVDHFKKVNDTYGHATGDEVLREVAYRLNDSGRSYDAVSRYGGEEFMIVLNGCRTQLGAKRAESIRHAIQARPVESAAGAVPVSMSLGVAGTDDWQELNAEQLIHEADLALYRAKHLGRNRSVIARPSGLEEVQTVNCVGRPSPCHLRNRLSRPLKSLAAPAASSAASPHSSLVHASRAMLPVACKLLPGSKRRSDF